MIFRPLRLHVSEIAIAPRRRGTGAGRKRGPQDYCLKLETTAVEAGEPLKRGAHQKLRQLAEFLEHLKRGPHGELTRQRHHLFRRSTQKGPPLPMRRARIATARAA
jgi:hypothetical protein